MNYVGAPNADSFLPPVLVVLPLLTSLSSIRTPLLLAITSC
jgi:hypothetical protein